MEKPSELDLKLFLTKVDEMLRRRGSLGFLPYHEKKSSSRGTQPRITMVSLGQNIFSEAQFT